MPNTLQPTAFEGMSSSPTHVNGIVLRMLQADRSGNKTQSAKNETKIINRKKRFKTLPFTFQQDRKDHGSSLAFLFKSIRRPHLTWLKLNCLAS